MIRCAPWISWVPGGDAITLFDDRDGSYHALNASASAIWAALGEGCQPDAASAAIAAERGLAIAIVRPDVDTFVALALDKGLLVTEDAG